MADSKKDIISTNIMDEISTLDIAGYLKQEVKDFLKYLHYYKIKNILQNIDALKEYLICLDHQNTNQIHELEYRKNTEVVAGEHDIFYYISTKGLEKVGEHKIHQKIWENDFNLSYIMQGIKGFLVLTADEFCNASPTRMSINRMLWQKQLQNTAKMETTEENPSID
ncbi:MAG: hypothetical protein ACD_80C00063G0005 [uncultured bacterium (gcode 4)]|uniref:Uncharacterized protein n=1 Tax=uncultured bacterium (gcode 4) TaxID=1234023 RepID=K1XJM2_9BACT|nr:MAG: hypothetical protein ACD_80C00063G0005 [uncultured bacterium (gcode 4)]HBB03494.1 hypothetical protein [Candidatus Gracilibacteria bacterium]